MVSTVRCGAIKSSQIVAILKKWHAQKVHVMPDASSSVREHVLRGTPVLGRCYQDCLPCMETSEVTLPLCGHTEVKYCYQDISEVLCSSPCQEKCILGHLCKQICSEECRPCNVVVKKSFICGHTSRVWCSEYSIAKCKKPCEKTLQKCGHRCPLTCGEPCSGALCPKLTEITLPQCGHKAKVPCHNTLYIIWP